MVPEEVVEKYDREMDRRTRQNLERFAEFMARTFLPSMARAALKLAAVVVFPTPPFWLQIAITLLIILLLSK